MTVQRWSSFHIWQWIHQILLSHTHTHTHTHTHYHGSSIVGGSDGVETLLSSCIPVSIRGIDRLCMQITCTLMYTKAHFVSIYLPHWALFSNYAHTDYPTQTNQILNSYMLNWPFQSLSLHETWAVKLTLGPLKTSYPRLHSRDPLYSLNSVTLKHWEGLGTRLKTSIHPWPTQGFPTH